MLGLLAFTSAIELELSRWRRRALVVLSGAMFGFGAACKWNAVDSWAVVLLASFTLLLFGRYAARSSNINLMRPAHALRHIGLPNLVCGLIAIPVLTYVSIFMLLFRATHTPFSIQELVNTHAMMLQLTKDAVGNKALSAPWYTWPFRASPVRGLSYLMGNFVVMWGGLVALAVCLHRLWRRVSLPEATAVLLYAANLLQWAVTPLKVPHYYYYYPAAMFLGPAIALALRGETPRRILGVRLSVLLGIAAFAFFVYCFPRMAHLEAPWDCMLGCWD
jgi:dolichyl-phosphate-mannose--protein O-mannosyl transferase